MRRYPARRVFLKAQKKKKTVALRCLVFAVTTGVCSSALAQLLSAPGYVSLSQSLAEQFGKTWKRGELCKVSLDGLSRRSADLLFSKRLEHPQLGHVMASYDDAVRLASGEQCERKLLGREIERTDAALRRYLQVPAPYRVEISPPRPLQP